MVAAAKKRIIHRIVWLWAVDEVLNVRAHARAPKFVHVLWWDRDSRYKYINICVVFLYMRVHFTLYIAQTHIYTDPDTHTHTHTDNEVHVFVCSLQTIRITLYIQSKYEKRKKKWFSGLLRQRIHASTSIHYRQTISVVCRRAHSSSSNRRRRRKHNMKICNSYVFSICKRRMKRVSTIESNVLFVDWFDV